MMLRTVAVALLLVAGCGSDDELDSWSDPGPPAPIDSSGTYERWVIDSVNIPDSASEAAELGLNLDGDEQGRPDNALGQILAAVFGGLGTEIDDKIAGEIASGRILQLLELQATSLEDANGVGVRLFLGEDTDGDPTDNFNGSETFRIEPGHPVRPMSGYIKDGRLHADRGILPLRIGFPEVDELFVLEIVAARIDAQIENDRVTGRLAGVLTERQIDEQLIPIIHASVTASVELDCDETGCEAGSNGELFLHIFDEDGDAAVSLEEVRTRPLISSLLNPDVDLFDEDGNYAPGCDGDPESLSLGVGFTAVRADFASP